MVLRQVSLLLLTILLLFPGTSYAQDKLLGKIDFPNSGAPEAQADFLEGVLFLHNFEYADAARSFKKAQEKDPDFVMAYWGEALTHNHPLWMQQDRDAAMEVLERLGKTVEARMETAPTQREKDYLYAVETLYGNTERARDKSKEDRDFLYRDAMRRLYETYPADHEATTLYGLSILGTAHEGRDFATYMRAAAVLQTVWEKNQKHPGAAHYLIHSFDDPIHAPLGLPMAQVYAEIAPAASHAQHMTSHIFVAMGMWDDVVKANEIARKVQNTRRGELGQRPNVCAHYPYWLEYGYLQQGRYSEAKAVLNTCYERLKDKPNDNEKWHFSVMRARYILDTEDWDAAGGWAAPDGVDMHSEEAYVFTSAVAAIHLGDESTAKHMHKKLMDIIKEEEGEPEELAIMDAEIQALMALKAGQNDKSIQWLQKAVELEAELPYDFGPPAIVKPSRELLGETYLGMGKYEEAVNAFSAQLKHTPLRTASLIGYARAAHQAGMDKEAKEAYQTLAEIWEQASSDLPQLSEVQHMLSMR